MDLSGLELFIPDIAAWLNIEPATLLLIIGVIVTVANLTSRLIPDDATGWLATVRKIASVIGAHASNRLTKDVTVNAVARDIIGKESDREVLNRISHLAQEPDALIPEVTEPQREPVHDPFGRAAAMRYDSDEADK